MENKIFLNRYRLSLRRNGLPVELHRSACAVTYRAQECGTGREVALTVVAPAPEGASTVELLHSQARAAREINQVNIPHLSEFGREDGELIYVTEYCEGPTAAAWVAARGPLQLGAVLRIALQVVDAMAATSFLRLYHPRLDPDHLVFVSGQTAEGDWPPVKVLDWFLPAGIWLEKSCESDEEQLFCSPEQLQTGEADLASEVYSLGAIMFFLLTGVAPNHAAERPVAALRGTPRIVRHLLERMLRSSPSERPQDPVALAAFLQTCLARVERRDRINRRFALPVSTQPRLGKEKSQHAPALLFSVAIALGLIIVAALGMVFFQWPSFHGASIASDAGKAGKEISPDDLSPAPQGSFADVAEGRSGAERLVSPRIPESSEDAAGDAESESPPAEGPIDSGHESAMPPAKASAAGASIAQARSEEGTDLSPNEKLDQVVQSSHRSKTSAAGRTPRKSSKSPVVSSAEATDEEPATQGAELPEMKQESSRSAATKPQKHSATRATASQDRETRDRRVAHTVKRARVVPALHVGGSSAQLVGTTADGHWILFVAESGQRIIVPPPPGYGD